MPRAAAAAVGAGRSPPRCSVSPGATALPAAAMGSLLSRRIAGVEDIDIQANSAYRYPPKSGEGRGAAPLSAGDGGRGMGLRRAPCPPPPQAAPRGTGVAGGGPGAAGPRGPQGKGLREHPSTGGDRAGPGAGSGSARGPARQASGPPWWGEPMGTFCWAKPMV